MMGRDRRLRTSRPVRVRGNVIVSHSGSCFSSRGKRKMIRTGCETPPHDAGPPAGRDPRRPPPDPTVAAAGGLPLALYLAYRAGTFPSVRVNSTFAGSLHTYTRPLSAGSKSSGASKPRKITLPPSALLGISRGFSLRLFCSTRALLTKSLRSLGEKRNEDPLLFVISTLASTVFNDWVRLSETSILTPSRGSMSRRGAE